MIARSGAVQIEKKRVGDEEVTRALGKRGKEWVVGTIQDSVGVFEEEEEEEGGW